jgi:glucose-6-phosphate isomerase
MSDLYLEISDAGISLDLRQAGLTAEVLAAARGRVDGALDEMALLEGGGEANSTEGRQVGHYWLRDAPRAPVGLDEAIMAGHAARGELADAVARRYGSLLHVGVGGSALGAQLLVDALGDGSHEVVFADNLDPEGLARVTDGLDLATTGLVVVSKSGSTAEVEVGLAHVRAALAGAELALGPRAVAITCSGSPLAQVARDESWRGTLPLWPWVGGRTSVFSSAGLFTAQVAGADADALLAGARRMDAATREPDLTKNPAALLALAWEAAQSDRPRAMVVLPYRDRLQLLGRYLQQLVMESLGKAERRIGGPAACGLTVYGNKGTTDQHAIVQQLMDGPDDCFVTFVEVLGGPAGAALESGVTAADLLSGFAYGTRAALSAAGRRTIALTLEQLDASSLGALIALFERAVGLYASFLDINAYDQPGVEAGKSAAAAALVVQHQLIGRLEEGAEGDAAHFASLVGADPQQVFHVLRHLASSGRARSSGEGLTRRFSAP